MPFAWPKDQGLSSVATRSAARQLILESIFAAKSGHPGGSLSLVEIMASIFDGHFEHVCQNPDWAARDRMVLSKGHGVPALYAYLSRMGYFEAGEMKNLRKFGHFLQGHPDHDKFPLMEASTGSLGQGASVALGLALGLRLEYQAKKIPRLPRVYCVLGDGEMQEGQVWECLMAAGKFQPGNLIFILDRNRGQIDGPVSEVMDLDPLEDKLAAFNLEVKTLDGHDVGQMRKTLSGQQLNLRAKPLFIVAETVKGKGVSFMEENFDWHGKAPSADELQRALLEINGGEDLPNGRILDGVN